MLKEGRVINNIGSLLSREALNKGALFFMSVFVARLLGRQSLGEYSIALIISNIIFFIMELGLNTLLIREVARQKEIAGKYLFNFSVIRLFSGLLGLALVFAVSYIMRCSKELMLINFLCGISYFIISFITLQSCLFRAFEKMKYEFFVSLVKNVIFLPLGILFLFKGYGLVAVFNLFLATNILAFILMQVYFRKENISYEFEMNFSEYPLYLKATIPLWVTQIFEVLFLRIASPLLYVFKGAEHVGIYNAGYVVFDGSYVIAGGIVMAIFPVLSNQYIDDREGFIKTYRKWVKNLFYLFTPLLLILFLLSDKFILCLYGAKFQPSVSVFRIVTGAALCQVLNTINYITLISMNKQKLLVLIMGAGMVLNLLLSAFLIPAYDFNGAGLSLLFSEIAVLSILFFAINRNLRYNNRI